MEPRQRRTHPSEASYPMSSQKHCPLSAQPRTVTRIHINCFPTLQYSLQLPSSHHIPHLPRDMPLFDYHVIAPSKQVEEGDRRLEYARALFEKHQEVMDPPDRDLAQSLLD